MKKNLLTVMFLISILCFGALVTNAKSSISSVKVGNNISKKAVEAKLGKINSSIIKAKVMCNSTTSNCFEMLADLMLYADVATSICGGAGGSNYDSYACQGALFVALAYGDYFELSGCGGLLPGGSVSITNTKKKAWIIRKEAVGIS